MDEFSNVSDKFDMADEEKESIEHALRKLNGKLMLKGKIKYVILHLYS